MSVSFSAHGREPDDFDIFPLCGQFTWEEKCEPHMTDAARFPIMTDGLPHFMRSRDEAEAVYRELALIAELEPMSIVAERLPRLRAFLDASYAKGRILWQIG